jgi:DNA-binding XRE family transcriptional regulator
MEKAEFNRMLGDFVKKKRIENGWTQADLAEKIGNNFQNISRIERGEISPTLFWCTLLAKAFDMTIIELVNEVFCSNNSHF